MNNYDNKAIKLILGEKNNIIVKNNKGDKIFSLSEFDFSNLNTNKSGDLEYFFKEGKYYEIQKEIIELQGEKVTVYRAHDITELLQKFREVEKIAQKYKEEKNKDSLTGLFNKSGFKEKFRSLLKEHKDESLCLVLLDIDYFKQINDNYGHTVADEVLKIIGPFIAEQFREKDIVGRFGGDEFVIACADSKTDSIAKKMEIIRQNILKLTNNKVNITVGINQYDTKKTYTENFENADIALYHGKQKGRGQIIIYTPDIAEKTELKITEANDDMQY